MDKIFKAFADKNRRKILSLLKNKELGVNELLVNFNISQATLSNHLSILRKAELVKYNINGKMRIYRLNNDLIKGFAQCLSDFAGLNKNFDSMEMKIRK